MSLICNISGVVPEEPVISKTGYIFEKRLILEYIKCNGSCPITKKRLDLEDLIEVNTGFDVKPRVISNTSIPGIIDTLRTEWDAIMMEMFQLKGELEQTKMQLSHALYQHEASCRVIARVSRERDGAIKRLAELSNSVGAGDNGDLCSAVRDEGRDEHRMEESPPTEEIKRPKRDDGSGCSEPSSFSDLRDVQSVDTVPKEVIAKFEEYSEKMKPLRKKMTFSNIPPSEQVKRMVVSKKVQIEANSELTHSAFVSDYVVLSGHRDGEVVVSSIRSNLLLKSEGDESFHHSSDIIARIPPISRDGTETNGVKFLSAFNLTDEHPSEYNEIPDKVIVSYSQNHSKVHVYSSDGNKSFKHLMDVDIRQNSNFIPKLNVESFQVHPLKKHVLVNSKVQKDNNFIGNITLLDIESGSQVNRYVSQTGVHDCKQEYYYSDLKIHPDGLIVGGVSFSTGSIDIWDLRTVSKITSIEYKLSENAHEFNKTCISFSNNGYHLFSTHDNRIHLWDLRKSSLLDSIDPCITPGNNRNIRINLDQSGKYVSSIHNNSVSIFSFASKNKLQQIHTLNDPSNNDNHYDSYIQNSHFSNNLGSIYTVSFNNILNIWSPSS